MRGMNGILAMKNLTPQERSDAVIRLAICWVAAGLKDVVVEPGDQPERIIRVSRKGKWLFDLEHHEGGKMACIRFCDGRSENVAYKTEAQFVKELSAKLEKFLDPMAC